MMFIHVPSRPRTGYIGGNRKSHTRHASMARDTSLEGLVEDAFHLEGELASATHPACVSHLALKLRRTRNAIAMLRSLEVQPDDDCIALTDDDLEIIG